MTEADLEAQMDAYWNKVPEIAAKKLNKELEDGMVRCKGVWGVGRGDRPAHQIPCTVTHCLCDGCLCLLSGRVLGQEG